MPTELPTLVKAALAGDGAAARELVGLVHPVVQARVVRVLRRARGAASEAWRPQIEDLVQDVFAALFRAEGKALRAWDPARGLSLQNYVGLFAERRAISSLRRVQPASDDSDVTMDELSDTAEGADELVESVVATREFLHVLLDRVRERLSPLGMRLFQLVYVEERSVEEIVAETSMSAEAVYAWRSRLRRLVGALAADLLAAGAPPKSAQRGGLDHET